jgi:hypothetical protein
VVDLDLKTPTPIVSGWKINNGEIKPYGAAIEMASSAVYAVKPAAINVTARLRRNMRKC